MAEPYFYRIDYQPPNGSKVTEGKGERKDNKFAEQ